MNNMDWLDSLTPQQMHLADMIIYKAKKEGVDPKLALALAFRESSLKHGSFEKDKDDKLVFKPTTGKSGEIGVMQVMPNTAKFHGYKPEDLHDLEKNMEIGLKVLKAHMGKFNDPLLAAAAYNAGPNHPYFQDPDKNPLPDTTQQYLRDLNQLGGFQLTAPVDQGAEPIPLSEDIGGSEPESPDWKEQFKEQLPAIAGAGVGAATGTTLAAGQKVAQGMNLLGDFLQRQPSAPAPSGDTSGTKWMRNWAGVDRPIAGGVPEASAAYQRSKGQGKVTGQLTKKFGPQALQPGGLSIQGQKSFPAPPPATSMLDDAVAKLGQIAKGALGVVSSAPVAGALGGAGAVTSGIEAYERGQKGDATGRNIAGLGTLQALAAIPHPVPQGIGLAAGIASPLGLAVLDRMRKIRAEPAPAPATEAEMQQAQQPAFRYARP